MDELRRIAMGYYQASTDDLQKLAGDFFKAMDHDGNGKIDLNEFMEFMRDEGYSQMTNPSFFNQLDLDRNGTLDFDEVMTVYYIVKSCRPFCDYCKTFISSTYFTCVGCLEDPIGISFYLCLDCYGQPKCGHTHNNVSRFLDNYSLLEAMNKSKLSEVKSPATRSRPFETVPALDKLPSSNTNSHTWNPSSAIAQVHNQHPWAPGASSTHPQNIAPTINNHTWVQNNYSIHYPPPVPVQDPAASSAIVPQRQDRKSALRLLNTAVQIAVLSSTLSSCSIL